MHDGQPVTIVVPDLAVPKCGNCGELVFDYEADDQITRAYAAQTSRPSIATLPADIPEKKTEQTGHPFGTV
jgi:hypothetical protein